MALDIFNLATQMDQAGQQGTLGKQAGSSAATLGANPTAEKQAQSVAPVQAAGGQLSDFQGFMQQRQQQFQQAQQVSQFQDNAQLVQSNLQQKSGLEKEQNSLNQNLTDQELTARKSISDTDAAQAEALQKYGVTMDLSLQALSDQQAKDLQAVGDNLKNQIFDARLKFTEDENQRQFTDARQLADYTLSTAKNQEQLKQNLNQVQYSAQLQNVMVQALYQKINETYNEAYQKAKFAEDSQTMVQLATIDAQMKAAKEKAQAKAAATTGMITGAFTIAGAVAGAIISVPTGGAAAPATVAGGAAVGAIIGGAVGGIVSQNPDARTAVGGGQPGTGVPPTTPIKQQNL